MLKMFKKLASTAFGYVYTQILPRLKPAPPLETSHVTGAPTIAIICDAMTWQGLKQENSLVAVSPGNWQDAFKAGIDFFLCESAWSGATNAAWRGQIYRDKRVLYENRRALLNILAYCNHHQIPTVFWAKEDPTYFQHHIYDFTDTALKFDYILTTAVECIPKYKALGHDNVHLWTFGFSPELYHPPKMDTPRENVAVFAGGWYKEHIGRCQDLTAIFDAVLSAGIKLRIYDRYKVAGASARPFPAKYQPYVQNAVPYGALGDIYRHATYAINVNTVSDSGTMFARRVYEAMACGCIVISNRSPGMEAQFGDSVWYVDTDKHFDFSQIDFSQLENIRTKNIDAVFLSHTWAQRMQQLQKILTDGSGI